MSLGFIAGFIILIVALFFAFDAYSYGIELKSTPLLIASPLLVIQAHYGLGGPRDLVRENCPEIAQFRPGSFYNEYWQIPLSEWNNCISKIAPSALVRSACLESESQAKRLFDEINSQNELVLGLEKYGVKFSEDATLDKITNMADNNACTRAVAGFAAEKKISIEFQPSKVLDVDKFSEGVSELDGVKLLEITGDQVSAQGAFKDYRITTFILLAGIFIFMLLIYSAFSRVSRKGSDDI